MTTASEVVIESVLYTDIGMYAAASCGKTVASIAINSWEFRVTKHNAMHKTWHGCGRGFDSKEAALAAYKSPEMKAIIEAVDKLNR